jgi:heme exporter protein B
VKDISRRDAEFAESDKSIFSAVSASLREIITVAAKDLRAEWRTKEALNASLAFSTVILVLFSFALDPNPEMMQEFSGGLLWLVFLFAGALVLNRSFAREMQNDCLDALLASPVPPSGLFLGKALANYALLMTLELICLAEFGVLFNVRWLANIGPLIVVMALGTWALTVVGTMFSALTVNLKLREVMLPVLVYPMMVPPMMAAMILTTALLNGDPLGPGNMLWVKVLAGFDVIFTLLGVAFVDTVLVG